MVVGAIINTEIVLLQLDTKLNTKARPVPLQIINVPGKNGTLIVAEPRKMSNGDMKILRRNYFINNISGIPEDRGGHYHPDKDEILFVARGSADFHLRDADGNEDHFVIDSNDIAIFVPHHIWHSVIISGDCLLIAQSPLEYDKDESVMEYPR